MKAVGYIRVSSEMQIETGHSLDAQRTLITEFARAKGWALGEIFCDAGLSGTLADRPAFQTLMARAEQHEFDVVVVHAIDRFYRDLSGLLAALHKLGERQITFVSITENLDFSTPWGKLILAVLGTLAEIYIDKLRDETKKGKLARAHKGLWNGSIPFGYCNGLCVSCTDVNGKDYCPYFGQPNRSFGGILIPHPIESVAVQLTYRWYDTTRWSHRVIAEKLNTHEFALPDGTTCHFRSKRYWAKGGPQRITQSTVREILCRVFYAGYVPFYSWNDRGIKQRRRHISSLVPGQHSRLISLELFERCQELAGLRQGDFSKPVSLSELVTRTSMGSV